MKDGSTFLALIPARSGSKRLPGKNVRALCGQPLISYTIEAAKKSKYIDRIIVSTDSQEIARIAVRAGAEVPFIRPAEFSSDTATSESVVTHGVEMLYKTEGANYDYVVLLQPTSPFRNGTNIDDAIEKLMKDDYADSIVSVTRVRQNPFIMKSVSEAGYLRDFLRRDLTSVRTQDLPELFIPNGAIYIVKTSSFLQKHSFYSDHTCIYLMSENDSLDIDDMLDFTFAEFVKMAQGGMR